MDRGLLSWNHRPYASFVCAPSCRSRVPFFREVKCSNVTFELSSVEENLMTARERRQMRNDRREGKPAYNWREDVETRLIKKSRKRYASWTEELNLDNLASLGLQWWIVRVSRISGQESAERMARALARNFPDMDFKVYIPSVQMKRKLKNGSITVKPKPLFPGCVFLKCVMNKGVHDFIRECDGIGGFVGSKVGNTKRQINKPRPVDADDIEVIFKQAKEEQQKADLAFEEEQKKESDLALDSKKLNGNSSSVSGDFTHLTAIAKGSGRGRKATSFKLGSSVRILSGTFAGFSGTIKKVDKRAGLATVLFLLFGKETLADIDTKDICHETNQ